jgi:putative acetyltransferase
MITFKRTDSNDPDFWALVHLLDEDLAIRDGAEHAFYHQFNKIANLRNVIVCYEGDKAVGCGAFRQYDHENVEIKRMFVLPAFRGRGIGLSILQELENWVAELNFTYCILETGRKQPEAISLYKKAGYQLIENYGQYKGVENSVCMTKTIL